jgi:hypothetical protein
MQVASAAIFAIDYEPRARRPAPGARRLRVTFVSGGRYVYAQVPREVHGAFLEAESRAASSRPRSATAIGTRS